MTSNSGPNTLLENILHLPGEIKAAIISDGRELIPVQLPDSPASSPTPPASSFEHSSSFRLSEISEITGVSPNPIPLKLHAGSPLQTFRRSRVPSESPGSPRSDFSRNSEESIIIVGDTFSAPMNLQFSVDGSPHIRDAGAFDRYSYSTSHSMSNSLSWRRDDGSPSLTSTPPTNSRRPLPLPSTPAPPILGSPLAPNQSISPAASSASSSISRPRTSPTGPRPLWKPVEHGEAGTKESRWKKKKKKGGYISSIGSGHESVQSSPRFDTAGGSQDWSPHTASPGLAPDRRLNPFATSFHPTADPFMHRAHSLPDEPTSEQTHSSNFHRQHSAEAYPPHSIHPLNRLDAPSEAHRIEQDIHHRQWSSPFQMQPFTFPGHQHRHQVPWQSSSQHHPHLLPLHPHYNLLQAQQQQRQAYYQNQVNQFAMMNLRPGFGTMQVLPLSALSAPMHAQSGPNQRLPLSYGQMPQSWPMEGAAPSLVHFHPGSSGSSESSTSTPLSAPVELPLDLLGHALTEIQIPETHVTTSIRHNPALERNAGGIKGPMNSSASPVDYRGHAPGSASQGNKSKQRGSPQPHGSKPPGPPSKSPRASGSSLMARGKSTLTPVTERSEISTPNASGGSTSASKEKNKKPKRRPRSSKGHPAAGGRGNHEASKKA